MAIVTNDYYLSLTQDNRVLRVRCSQGDSSRNINLILYNNGSVFTIPSGVSASVRGVRQNGSVFSQSCSIIQGRTGVVLALNSAINGVAGIAVAEIVLTDGSGNKVGTSNFIIQVESNLLLRGTVEVGEESPVEYISDFIDAIDALNARVNNIISPSGDASLSEVVDARLSGHSNTTYQNLKARIDADFASIDNSKADKSNTYTKEEVDEAIGDVEIMTDETLSVSGAAADAKATGDAISELNESLSNIESDIQETLDGSVNYFNNSLNQKADKNVATRASNGLMSAQDKAMLDDLNAGGLQIEDEVISEKISDWLSDHPEATTTVQNGSITDEKLSSSLSSKIEAINKLIVEDVFDCTGIGIDAASDTALIQQILSYSKSNGYQYVLFPKDSNWLLLPERATASHLNYTIMIPSNTTVDLNGSTWSVANSGISGYDLISFEAGSEYSCLCNGVIYGDNGINPSANGNECTIGVRGYHNSIQNMTLRNMSGDGIGIGSAERIRGDFGFQGDELFSNYSYLSGEAVEDTNAISLTEPMDITQYYGFEGDFFIWFGGGNLFDIGKLLYKKDSYFIVYFYDANNNLLKKRIGMIDCYIPKNEIPVNTVYFRWEIKSHEPITVANENAYWRISEVVGCDFCTLEGCHVEYAGRNGITVGSCYGARIKDCIVDNATARSPAAGIDIEPSRAKAVDVTIENVRIYNCVTAVYCSATSFWIKFRKCWFSKRFTCALAEFLTIEDCIFEESANFPVLDSVGNSTPRATVRHCQFFKSSIGGSAEIFDSKFIIKDTTGFYINARQGFPIRFYRCEIKANKIDVGNELFDSCTFEPYDVETFTSVTVAFTKFKNCKITGIDFIVLSPIIDENVTQSCLEFINCELTQNGSRGLLRSVGSNTYTYDRIRFINNFIKSNNGLVYGLSNTLYCKNGLFFVGNSFENPVTLNIDHDASGGFVTDNISDVVCGLNRNATITVE